MEELSFFFLSSLFFHCIEGHVNSSSVATKGAIANYFKKPYQGLTQLSRKMYVGLISKYNQIKQPFY